MAELMKLTCGNCHEDFTADAGEVKTVDILGSTMGQVTCPHCHDIGYTEPR